MMKFVPSRYDFAPLALALALAAAAGGCARDLSGPAPDEHDIFFVDVGEQWGVSRADASDMRSGRAMSSIASGAGFGDFDGDGLIDLAVNRGPRNAQNVVASDRMWIYRNTGQGRFEEVSAELGVDQRLYGSGAYWVDYDGDGDLDLFTTNYPACRLWRNDGGRFADVTEAAGLGQYAWASSAAWLDYDNDGDLDVYVLNYLISSLALEKERSDNLDPSTPSDYHPWPNVLYRNNGDGTFTDATKGCGCEDPDPGGKSLAVGAADFDGDGWVDIYIANDTVLNSLYHNNGDGTFSNIGLEAGVALNAAGEAEGSMGVAIGDPNNDGLPDIFVTNFVTESNTFYLNLGDNVFIDHTREAGLEESGVPWLGWGTAFADLDLDGDEDLIAVNGQLVQDLMLFMMRWFAMSKKPMYAPYLAGDFNQPILIYENTGDGEFVLISEKNARPLPPIAARGLAMGDIDSDGDLDFYVQGKDDRSALLENRSRRRGQPLKLYLRGTRANRQAVGAQVRLETTKGEQFRWIKLGSSFLSGHEVMAHFGVPEGAEIVRAVVSWPGGGEQIIKTLEPGGSYLITEGTVVAKRLDAAPGSQGYWDAAPPARGSEVRLVSNDAK